MNIELPKRSDKYYTQIAKFEKCKYTHCLAYELAIRNTNVENSLNLLFDLFMYYQQNILPILTKYEKATIADDMLEAIDDVGNIYKKFFIDLVNNYDKKQFLGHFESLTFKNIKEKIAYLVNTILKELYDNYYIIYQHDSETFTNDFNEIYDPLIYLERDKALTKYIKDTYINETSLKENSKFNYDQNEYFAVFQDIHENQEDFSFSTIYPNFSTALRDFTDTKIMLNLNFSKDEIMDYIEKIKNDYDNKSSIIKTPRQLLEEELEIYSEVNGIVETEKWEDILFIYDYYHVCQSYTNKKDYEIGEKIQIELTKYHGLKIKKTSEEIRNKKDTRYKQVSWADYIKNNPETNESNIFFDKDTKPYLSTKAIKNKYNLIKGYIEGGNPKYKTLVNKDAL
jgi:hypothetical protein